MRALALSLTAILAALPARADAPVCPPVLAEASRLVLITADARTVPVARLRRYLRGPEGAWRQDGAAEPAVIGAKGLAWSPAFRTQARRGEAVKVEGDGRSPAGIFALGHSFGFTPSDRPGHLVLRKGETICVDDPASPAYNTIVSRSSIGPDVSGEDMGAIPLYRRGLLVEYPTDAAAHGGSCIFIHLWRGAASGTAGCVALPEARLAELQDFARERTALAILPAAARDRFAGCLPPD